MRIFVCNQCGSVLAIAGDHAHGSRMGHTVDGVRHEVPSPGVVDAPWIMADAEDGYAKVVAWLDAHPGATGDDLVASFPMPDGWTSTQVAAPADPEDPAVRAEVPRIRGQRVAPDGIN